MNKEVHNCRFKNCSQQSWEPLPGCMKTGWFLPQKDTKKKNTQANLVHFLWLHANEEVKQVKGKDEAQYTFFHLRSLITNLNTHVVPFFIYYAAF